MPAGEQVWEKFYNMLEDRVVRLERDMAVREETFKGVEIRLKAVESVLSRLTWTIITAVVLAGLGYIVGPHVIH